jgi:hypothetical protein
VSFTQVQIIVTSYRYQSATPKLARFLQVIRSIIKSHLYSSGDEMGIIFDTFTIAGIVSGICTILAVLIVLDCCKIRNNLSHKVKHE